MFVEDRRKQDSDIPEFIDIGVCSLHVVHEALQTGVHKNGWEIQKLLKLLWWLFHNIYGRVPIITKCDIFPKKFCVIRWVEDKDVANHVIHIWPNVTKYINETLKLKPSEVPTCESFHTTSVLRKP